MENLFWGSASVQLGWWSCALPGGRHERSEKHAQRIGEGEKFVSKCRYCGVHMTRRAKRDWIVTPKGAR
ncbi:hypothetical protein FHR20_002213 [Sphingomonas leidyi]|uniref:Uncharacterized protein n=1 Tax=Sphingomonas leidyi TaxID=68569 RepID=A0A7X5V0P0_9SPHN|nr:hypothetical protein [Sphingomonas leidyi]